MFPLGDDQPSYSRPVVCILLIVINCVVFLHEMLLDDFSRNFFVEHYALIPDSLRLTTLVTMQFIHGGWLHIIGNMVFLWAFGRTVESAMGSPKFLAFYLLCGVLAGLTQAFMNLSSHVPAVGASGAIAGVMGAYLVKFPWARIRTLVFVILIFRVDIPAMLYLPYWFLTQFFSGVGSVGYSTVSEGGTAWFAHIGGFVAGMVLVLLMGTQTRYVRRIGYRW